MAEETCSVEWNPEVWPYVARCAGKPGHAGDEHVSRGGAVYVELSARDCIDQSVRTIVTLLIAPDYRSPSLHRDKLRTLAMEWPSLAAALGMLVGSVGQEVPSPLRRALAAMEKQS